MLSKRHLDAQFVIYLRVSIHSRRINTGVYNYLNSRIIKMPRNYKLKNRIRRVKSVDSFQKRHCKGQNIGMGRISRAIVGNQENTGRRKRKNLQMKRKSKEKWTICTYSIPSIPSTGTLDI
jgi:hypothetical protein